MISHYLPYVPAALLQLLRIIVAIFLIWFAVRLIKGLSSHGETDT